MKYAIVTGTSKGLGAAIAELLLKNDIHVIGIARHVNKQLSQLADQSKVTYQHFSCDLADVDQLDRTFEKVNDQIFKKETSRVYLINSAATVNPIDTVANHTIEAIQAHMQINLIAPMLTTSLVLKKAKQSGMETIVANISSGAADRSTYGWSAYGASKAGLNRYTQTVALEEEQLGTSNKIILFDPSIMDTEMQRDIRAVDQEAFQEVEQFKQYKKQNKLRDKSVVAQVFVNILVEPAEINNGHYYSIKDYV
ncbi:(S)-benzoin forming benzil reductase [Amphibacillus jilinensis]|uniref:(S)-benzoin forming benzil reductase n=1 Tax=Amphibacillus jilinensis TaxID=1216008 RepID=UPI0002F0B042|nr:(S)-benzoin forming benzil reductase [Amphibacillus jilinensis]